MGDIIVVRPRTALWRRFVLRRPPASQGPHAHLHAVDLGTLLSRHIHETEKNLHRLFELAEHADVLVYDDADALFGHGSTASGRTSLCPDGAHGCVHLTPELFLEAVRRIRHR
ncbi:MAG: hypothetical protein ABW040_05745 [Microbacteriaceae bacterium]